MGVSCKVSGQDIMAYAHLASLHLLKGTQSKLNQNQEHPGNARPCTTGPSDSLTFLLSSSQSSRASSACFVLRYK